MINVVVVGHVDHGKSTLLGRLLFDTGNVPADRLSDIQKVSADQKKRMEYAFLLDQFQEERDANITIDTTQTFLSIEGHPFLLIDAPGHKEYLRNMITGATQAKNAILLLDIKEGLRDQTDRHARVLKFLAINRVAVAINKMDLVECSQSAFESAKAEVEALFKEVGLAPDVIVPISAYDGENLISRSKKMPWYTGATVKEFLLSLKEEADLRASVPFCFPIQLVSTFEEKPILMGRLEQGVLKVGEEVTVFPVNKKATVSKLFKHDEPLKQANAGDSIALQLSPEFETKRGMVLLSAKGSANFPSKFRAHTFWASETPLVKGDTISVDCRTQNAKANVISIFDELGISEKQKIENGDVALLEIKSGDTLLVTVPSENEALSRLVFHKDGNVSGCGVVHDVEY